MLKVQQKKYIIINTNSRKNRKFSIFYNFSLFICLLQVFANKFFKLCQIVIIKIINLSVCTSNDDDDYSDQVLQQQKQQQDVADEEVIEVHLFYFIHLNCIQQRQLECMNKSPDNLTLYERYSSSS